ncbi:MAG: DNA repair and recombination protein RadA [Candidatus Bathyarchaeota archaeon]|nr:DNA repair and recombination protein RadA [Candidatus Bathyarchaeota archaeon]MDH5733226.1 DNA repair and recombination protein RadA [Candidatus Bathyarchaeota archaeon]
MKYDDPATLEGVGPAIASKLRSAGITTVEAIAVTPPREIAEKTAIGFNTIIKIAAAARKSLDVDFITAEELWKRRQNMLKCSTGSKNLDELLGGGIETQAMTEFIGEYGVGKTQICLMLCVMAQLPAEKRGLNGNVVYIDTEGTFIPERIFEIANALGSDPHKTLGNIFLARAYNSSHQCLLIDSLFKFCPENNVKLIIVDSMIGHFRSEYVGREHLSERQQKLNNLLHKLLRLTEAFNLPVIVTNQVQANPAQFFGDPNKPAGGHIMAHACTHRVYLRKGSKGTRIAKVIDSPYLPESSTRFKITEKGIEDVQE